MYNASDGPFSGDFQGCNVINDSDTDDEELKIQFSPEAKELILKGGAEPLQRNFIFGAHVQSKDMYPVPSDKPKPPDTSFFASPLWCHPLNFLPFRYVPTGRLKRRTRETDETDIFLKRFLDVLKHYWLKLVKTTKQGLVLEYFHQDRFNVTNWFESIKQSSVTRYMQKIGKDWSEIDLTLHKPSRHETLIFISLVFSYNNNLLEILKKNKKEGKLCQETDNLCEAVEAVSSVIVIFQALMPWSTSSCLKELRGRIDILQNKIDRMSFAFEYQPFTNLDFIQNLVVYDIDVLCNVLGLETQFSQFAKNVGVDMWLHDLQSSHVLNWLKRNNESMLQSETSTGDMSIANALKQKLVLLGFTKWKAASIADDIPEDWINHQSALDLATSHILDMFQCHPVLRGKAPVKGTFLILVGEQLFLCSFVEMHPHVHFH